MFDFFKDLYFELNGYNMEKIREQKKEKLEQEKRGTILLKKTTKKIILIFFLLNLPVCVISLIVAIKIFDTAGIIKNIIILISTIITIFALLFKGKGAEVTAILFMILTILLTFMIPII